MMGRRPRGGRIETAGMKAATKDRGGAMMTRAMIGGALATMVAIAVAAGAAAPANSAESATVLGTWQNPRGTLAVRTAPCGPNLCGAIVWASAQALADAREAGISALIGTQLLQSYTRLDGASWAGRVYVPDMGRTFASRLVQTSPTTLKISGCLVGGFLCKSQTWHRVS